MKRKERRVLRLFLEGERRLGLRPLLESEGRREFTLALERKKVRGLELVPLLEMKGRRGLAPYWSWRVGVGLGPPGDGVGVGLGPPWG